MEAVSLANIAPPVPLALFSKKLHLKIVALVAVDRLIPAPSVALFPKQVIPQQLKSHSSRVLG